MGYLGKSSEDAVQKAVRDGIKRIIATGKPAGILATDKELAQQYIDLGASFVAVGIDTAVFSSALRTLLSMFHQTSSAIRSE